MSSVKRVIEEIKHFSNATGFKANLDKSSMFLAGVDEQIKQMLLSQTWFTIGISPIRYLGLPLSSKKYSRMECHLLVDRPPIGSMSVIPDLCPILVDCKW